MESIQCCSRQQGMEHLCEGVFGDVWGKDSTQQRQIPKEPVRVKLNMVEET